MKKHSLLWFALIVVFSAIILIVVLTYVFLGKDIALSLVQSPFSSEVLLAPFKDLGILVVLALLFFVLLKNTRQETGTQTLSDVYANPSDSVTVGFKKFFKNTEYGSLRVIIISSTLVGILFSIGLVIYFQQ